VSRWTRVTRGESNIDFVGKRRIWLTISVVLVAGSLLALGVRNLNLGLEFTGGISVEAENPAGADVADIRQAIADAGLPPVDRIQLVDDGNAVRVQTTELVEGQQALLVDTVETVAGAEPDQVSVSFVGPSFGALVTRRALEALAVFLGVAALFISWRLQWKMAAAGLVALIHDLVLTTGIYAVTGFSVTPATVVALLTILGYSLYDTVVVFDKVEEIEQAVEDEPVTYSSIVNRAMNTMLSRSILTSLTSLLPVGCLLFIGSLVLGATTLQDFSLALFVGIAAGTYSSIAVAAPLLATWKEREGAWIERRERAERRPTPARTKPAKSASVAPAIDIEAASVPASSPGPDHIPESTPGETSGPRPPRPPKRRRR
jgi:preprotein translocase subunit SecF